MSENCCQTTEDGSAVCVVSDAGGEGEQPCSYPTNQVIDPTSVRNLTSAHETGSRWRKIRGAVMFGVACVTSPCCTPLIVPILIALLAGTPAAVWMSQNLGLVFGGLTLLSAVSFVLGLRWMRQKSTRTASARKRVPAQPVIDDMNVQPVTSK